MAGVLLDEHLLQLRQEGQAQVAVLAEDPVTRLESAGDEGVGGGFLPLAHADGADPLLPLLGQALNLPRRVRPLGQEEDDRHEAVALLHDGVKVQLLGLGVLRAEGVLNVVDGRQEGAVLAEAADEQEALEGVQPVVDVWNLGVLRRLCIPPLPPHEVVALDEVRQVLERLHCCGQSHDVEPGLVRDPLEGLGPAFGHVQGSPRLEEGLEALVGQCASPHLDLAGHEQDEHELVLLKQAPPKVLEHNVRCHVDDARNALGRELVALAAINA
mmetsp:Transcript_3401/g.5807  ORF Transcript_3401/g.5807 Transcript_3401/m.5807 type:complete len:271 (+) Transcript_3401:1664-2476(+)